MVQLSPSPNLDDTPPPQRLAEGEERQEDQRSDGGCGSPKVASPGESMHLNLEVSTAYHGYETYIEDGLICLKHKVRNLEKKKVGQV